MFGNRNRKSQIWQSVRTETTLNLLNLDNTKTKSVSRQCIVSLKIKLLSRITHKYALDNITDKR